jgi:iron(III) transport system substrate-binding protein
MFHVTLRLFAIAAAAAAFGLPVAASAEGEVNLYSARQENLIKPLLDDFTRDTGIRVNLLTGRADELLQRLRLEGRNSPADVLITVDAGNLHQATEAGVLSAIDSEILERNVPENYRDVEGRWYGLSLRARPIMYHRDRVDPAELSTYEALTDPKWRGRICIRSSANVYNQSMVAAMIASEAPKPRAAGWRAWSQTWRGRRRAGTATRSGLRPRASVTLPSPTPTTWGRCWLAMTRRSVPMPKRSACSSRIRTTGARM